MRIKMLETRESPEHGRLEAGKAYDEQLPDAFKAQLIRQGFARKAEPPGKGARAAHPEAEHPQAKHPDADAVSDAPQALKE